MKEIEESQKCENFLVYNNYNNTIKRNFKTENISYSTSIIVDENILNVREILQDKNVIRHILPKEIKNFESKNQIGLWKLGNKIKIEWVNKFYSRGTCIDVKFYNLKIEILWEIKTPVGLNFYKKLIFYNTTYSKSTLIKLFIYNIDNVFVGNQINENDLKKNFEYIETTILSNFKKYLKIGVKRNVNQESCIINKNTDIVKKLLFSVDLCKEIPIVGSNFSINGDFMKVGSFFKFKRANENKITYAVIKDTYFNPKRNSQMIQIETIGSSSNKNERFILQVILTKISDDKTLLSLINIISYINKKTDFSKVYSGNKRYFLNKFKIYANNYK